MKRLLTVIAAAGLMVAGTRGVRGAEQTWSGMISDSLCGASHDGMRKKGEKITDRECTVACVNYQTPGAPKFVFVSGGKVFAIKNQDFGGLGRRSGTPVTLTGDLDASGAITIARIEMAKKG